MKPTPKACAAASSPIRLRLCSKGWGHHRHHGLEGRSLFTSLLLYEPLSLCLSLTISLSPALAHLNIILCLSEQSCSTTRYVGSHMTEYWSKPINTNLEATPWAQMLLHPQQQSTQEDVILTHIQLLHLVLSNHTRHIELLESGASPRVLQMLRGAVAANEFLTRVLTMPQTTPSAHKTLKDRPHMTS